MKLTTINGEQVSVKDLKTEEPLPHVVEVQSEEDVGKQKVTEEVPF